MGRAEIKEGLRERIQRKKRPKLMGRGEIVRISEWEIQRENGYEGKDGRGGG